MANRSAEHILTIGTVKYLVHLPDEYEAVGELVGIKKVTEAEQKTGAVPSSVNTLYEYGQVLKVRVGTGTSAVAGRKLKYRRIVCPVDRFPTARGSLIGKSLGTQGEIQTVGLARKRRLG